MFPQPLILLHQLTPKSQLKPTDKLIASIDNSPKPPPKRITLTLSALEAAKEIVFLVTGAGKADVIQDIIEVRVIQSTGKKKNINSNICFS